MSNLLIVEGKSDKLIIEALIAHINSNVTIDEPICNINECAGIGGLNNKLVQIQREIKKNPITKIGIIFDADNIGIDNRKSEITSHIESVFGTNHNISFKIHILNIAGQGELETILKLITSNEPTMANCLDKWQECLSEKRLNEKELNKLWIQVYQKYDCCTKDEQENMRDNCNNQILLKEKVIYNFDKDIQELNDLKEFLQQLGED